MRALRVFLFGVIAISAAAAVATGKDPEPKNKKDDPQNRAALSKQMAAVVEGNAKFAEKDYPAALDAYKRATQLAPTDPLGPYLVAEAELAQGHFAEGEAALAQAEKLEGRRPEVIGKVLFLKADASERQKKWADAKASWLRYKEWAEAHADSGAVLQTATARVQAIDEALKLGAQYEDVRKRIAAEKGDAGKGDGGK